MKRIMTKAPPERVTPPFAPLGPLSEAARRAVTREAERVNDRYLDEFLERWAFCPFSKEGRKRGEVFRYVHLFETLDLEPVFALHERIVQDERQVVAQIIAPGVEVDAEEWATFAHALTAVAHARLGKEVVAVAPLHPELPYGTGAAAEMVPLFRRTPDPTIQWVRLDALERIYKGRGAGTVFVDAGSVEDFLAAMEEAHKPLWDSIADSNAKSARSFGLERLERLLASIAQDARESFARARATPATPNPGTSEDASGAGDSGQAGGSGQARDAGQAGDPDPTEPPT